MAFVEIHNFLVLNVVLFFSSLFCIIFIVFHTNHSDLPVRLQASKEFLRIYDVKIWAEKFQNEIISIDMRIVDVFMIELP